MGTLRRPLSLGILALALVFLSVRAAPAPAQQAAAAPAPAAGLTAIDVPEGALPVLQRLGIKYQDVSRAGLIRAAASPAQLQALAGERIAYTAVGPVAILEAGASAAALCTAESSAVVEIQQGYAYDSVTSNCSLPGTADWVDVHYRLHHVAGEMTPDQYRLYEIGLMLSVDGNYYSLEGPGGCMIPAPASWQYVETYDHWIFHVANTGGASLNVPASNTWTLVAIYDCLYHAPDAQITYFGAWIYYHVGVIVLPTETPTPSVTPTPSRTPTRTSTPRPTPTRTPILNVKYRAWLPLVLRNHR